MVTVSVNWFGCHNNICQVCPQCWCSEVAFNREISRVLCWLGFWLVFRMWLPVIRYSCNNNQPSPIYFSPRLQKKSILRITSSWLETLSPMPCFISQKGLLSWRLPYKVSTLFSILKSGLLVDQISSTAHSSSSVGSVPILPIGALWWPGKGLALNTVAVSLCLTIDHFSLLVGWTRVNSMSQKGRRQSGMTTWRTPMQFTFITVHLSQWDHQGQSESPSSMGQESLPT